MSFNEYVFLALGILSLAVGLYGLLKFRRDLVAPPDEAHRTIRLPFILWLGRYGLAGIAFIVAGFTGSLIAVGAGALIWLTEPLLGRFLVRRLEATGHDLSS